MPFVASSPQLLASYQFQVTNKHIMIRIITDHAVELPDAHVFCHEHVVDAECGCYIGKGFSNTKACCQENIGKFIALDGKISEAVGHIIKIAREYIGMR